jgi:hypothetical protein
MALERMAWRLPQIRTFAILIAVPGFELAVFWLSNLEPRSSRFSRVDVLWIE